MLVSNSDMKVFYSFKWTLKHVENFQFRGTFLAINSWGATVSAEGEMTAEFSVKPRFESW